MNNAFQTKNVIPTAIPNAPIALLDSGAGGLTVLREAQKALPCERFLYFADAANAPYGTKAPDEVRGLVMQNAARLLRASKALLLACNTATALAADALRARYPDRVILGMEPALLPACRAYPGGRIAVLATPTTLQEQKFCRLLEKCRKTNTVLPLPAPGIVPFVEAGRLDDPALDRYLQDLLAPLRACPPDAVVLGCTHFPLVAEPILRAIGRPVPIFDGTAGTVRELCRRLGAADLLQEKGKGELLLLSGDPNTLPLYRRLLAHGE